MAIPKIIHQVKVSMPLSTEEARLGRRLRALMPDWEYYLRTDADHEALLREHFPQYLSSYQNIQRGVVKVDVIRHLYMAVYGGFYIETDYKLLRRIDDSWLDHKCILPVARVDDGVVILGNAVLGSEPGYPFWTDLVEHMFEQERRGKSLATLAESELIDTTGPGGMSEFFRAHQNSYPEAFLPPQSYFHPKIKWRGVSADKSEETLGVHLCWGAWRSKGMVYRAADALARQISSLI